MNSRYDDISFDIFSAEEESKLTEIEEQGYINNFYENIGGKRDNKKSGKVTIGRLSRKFVVVAAAMAMVMAFGAIAYAADWFRLGEIDTQYDRYELIAVDDSAQYKAAKEAMDYWNSLTVEERIALDEERYDGFEDTGKTNDKEKSITFAGPGAKTQELLDKYDLKFERTHYYVSSAEEAFEKVGIGNILGDFWDIDKLRSSDDFVYDDGYIYTDQGSVTIMGGGESSSDSISWELHMIPRDVYISPWASFVSSDEKESPEYTEWNFVTEKGYSVKAASYIEDSGVILENGESEPRTYKHFRMLMINETHTVDMYYSVNIDDPQNDMSNQEFEEVVDKLDFSKVF